MYTGVNWNIFRPKSRDSTPKPEVEVVRVATIPASSLAPSFTTPNSSYPSSTFNNSNHTSSFSTSVPTIPSSYAGGMPPTGLVDATSALMLHDIKPGTES